MTETEMWNWPDRRRSVWDRTLGLRKAANFGSQGTRFESLLWRMQNGELDVPGEARGAAGVRPRRPGDGRPGGRVCRGLQSHHRGDPCAPAAGEDSAFRRLSRGQLDRTHWRQVAEENAAVYRKLADEQTVFYVDIGERFFLPDGSHNQEMWRFPPLAGGANVGAQTPTFDVWAEELQPRLDRFVR